MRIDSSNINLNYKGSLKWNKTVKETSDYAKKIGQFELYKTIRNKIKELPEANLHITHRYCKTEDLVKTEFRFLNHGYKNLFIKTNTEMKNPAEFTFLLLQDLLDETSWIYKRIYK